MLATLHIRTMAFLIAMAISAPGMLVERPDLLPAFDASVPLDTPDRGSYCAESLDPDDLTRFFAEPIGTLQGSDYQRSVPLPDGRVLWTFQDAFVSGTLVHNVALIQSGRCFEPVSKSTRSWLMSDETVHMQRWHWILGGGIDASGTAIHLYVVEMRERGSAYLTHVVPMKLRRVVLNSTDLTVIDVVEEPTTGADLYGWSITADRSHTYLYSHCYRQFGFDGLFGFDDCVTHVKLARVPLGRFDAAREYWDGSDWTSDHRDAAPVVDGAFAGSGNNPAQVAFDGEQFLLVEKRDDWMGETLEFGASPRPEGPFIHIGSMDQPTSFATSVDQSAVNTYFASWVPTSRDQRPAFCISHNLRDGRLTYRHLDDYRPTCHAVPDAVLARIERPLVEGARS